MPLFWPYIGIYRDALRHTDGSFTFRHTIVSEFVYPDQRQAIKRLDRRIGQVGRSAQSPTGKSKFSPEARVALEDLARLRQDLAGGRAALAGEADDLKTGREIIETAHSLAPLIPTESEWEGAPRPHTLFSLPTGRLIGIEQKLEMGH